MGRIRLGAVALLVMAEAALYAGEGNEGLRSVEEIEKVLKLEFAPLLDEQGVPKSLYAMIVNTGDKLVVVKSDQMNREKLFWCKLFVETGEPDEEAGSYLGTGIYSLRRPGPKERTHVLEPGAFVGVVVSVKEESRKALAPYMKPGRKMTISGSVHVDSGPVGSKDDDLKRVTLWGEDEFIIGGYPKKKSK